MTETGQRQSLPATARRCYRHEHKRENEVDSVGKPTHNLEVLLRMVRTVALGSGGRVDGVVVPVHDSSAELDAADEFLARARVDG